MSKQPGVLTGFPLGFFLFVEPFDCALIGAGCRKGDSFVLGWVVGVPWEKTEKRQHQVKWLFAACHTDFREIIESMKRVMYSISDMRKENPPQH
jgi:hypothetical protein